MGLVHDLDGLGGRPLGRSVRDRPSHTSTRGRDPLDDVTDAHTFTSQYVIDVTDASYRQLDYWARNGLLGAHVQRIGSGGTRRFTREDLEVVEALVCLSALGATAEWMMAGADCVRGGPVDPAGERLIVLLDGSCYRHPAGQPVKATGPGWIVPLVSHGAHA